MIELTARRGTASSRCIKIIGIGGAGANALDRIVLDGVNPSHLIAANSDTLALSASVAGEKVQLGRLATRGLGCGGDPDLGRASAEESVAEIRNALNGIDCLFLLAGLGGGTGSGATPVIAELARESGALVIAVVTLPFAFEGKRRIQQAAEALEGIQKFADAVVCFENDRMADAVSPKAGIQQAFAAADQTISQSVQAIAALLCRQGMINLGFDDFRAALQPVNELNPRCLFGYGEAGGDNRPYDALALALKCPLMDKGRLLRGCDTVLVQVSGGPDLTLNEVQLLMEEFNRHVDDRTRVLFGAAVDPELAGRIAVTVLSSLSAEEMTGIQTPCILPAREPAPKTQPMAPRFFTDAPNPEEIVETPEPAQELEEAFVTSDFEASMEPVPAEASGDPLPDEYERQNEEDESAGVEPVTEVTASVLPIEPDFLPESEEPIDIQPTASAAQPERPAKRRTLADTAQISFFGEEPTPEPAQKPAPAERPKPAFEKAVRPIPGRTLQRDPIRAPENKVAPVATPKPEPKPEPAPVVKPERSRIIGTPRPDPVQSVAATAPSPAPAPSSVAPTPVTPPSALTGGAGLKSAPTPYAAPKTPSIPAPISAGPSAPKSPQQETLQFEPVTRGRFEKSEPTIIDGQDLDVPTFLRRNIRIR